MFVIVFAWCMDLSRLANMKCKNTHSDDGESHEKYDNVFGGIKNIFTCNSKILTDLLNTSACHGDQALTKSSPGQSSSPDILRAHLAKSTVTTH